MKKIIFSKVESETIEERAEVREGQKLQEG